MWVSSNHSRASEMAEVTLTTMEPSPMTRLDTIPGRIARHLPTCSSYADEAIGRFGLWAGGWMTLARLCRCHPWGTSGLDFVPPSLDADARWYLPWRYGRWRGTNPGPVADVAEPEAPRA